MPKFKNVFVLTKRNHPPFHQWLHFSKWWTMHNFPCMLKYVTINCNRNFTRHSQLRVVVSPEVCWPTIPLSFAISDISTLFFAKNMKKMNPHRGVPFREMFYYNIMATKRPYIVFSWNIFSLLRVGGSIQGPAWNLF